METRHPEAQSPAAAEAVPATFGTRRDFCVAACQAISLGAIAATLQACGGGGNPNEPSNGGGTAFPTLQTFAATVVNGATTLTVDASSPLASAGGAALVTTSTFGTVLVLRSDATNVSVLTATCTHQQCTINGFQGGVFECPCHGSRFNATGQVQRGPATASLRRFTATLTGNVITITA
jgi:nitrite reductase/ring-hydroxylating ferredoxin subunit